MHLNILDSALGRGKEFSDYLHNDFEHFWKIKGNNSTGWVNLESLSKVTKEKMSSDAISQFQMCIKTLKTSICHERDNSL